MFTKFGQITITVKTYDEALDFYIGKLGFKTIKDVIIAPGMRWVVIAPRDNSQTVVVLEAAKTAADRARLGKQFTGMTLTLETDDLNKTYEFMKSNGVEFVEAPNNAPWGKQAAFKDLYGNIFDLVEPAA